jgi:hypothetical protein
MKTELRRFSEDEIKRIRQAASSHPDPRARASTSLLLALSIPLSIQEFLLWKNIAVVSSGDSITIIGRFLRLEVSIHCPISKHLIKLRAVSTGTRVFTKPTQDSSSLTQLNGEILVQANVLNCSHKDLSEWSRRQAGSFRRSL